ncbi:MAG: TIGR00295 family protein [Crenarchaeota archaeon]|nr:TIGR00295 family protein [Thermoproteota archaeon]MDW8033875.1 TIGR00295 family protein [Nitrososphaerota archaeon]
MKKKSSIPEEEECLKILQDEGVEDNVIRHAIRVSKIARELASRIRMRGYDVDEKLVVAGALLHDIGRSVTHDVSHGVIGGRIIRRRRLDERLARIVERHVGGGITRDEAEKLKLSDKDLIPETLEEKIVCYADKLVDGDKKVNFEETLKYFKEKLGPEHPAIKRLEELNEFFSKILS